MKLICKFLVKALHSKLSFLIVITFCIGSFLLGQRQNDMNLFAASGGVMTIFGLLSTIRFSTLEKYLNKDALVAKSTGVTGPPLSEAELEKLISKNRREAEVRLTKELKAELLGIGFTLVGTLIWAYGIYVPIVL